MKTLVFIFGLCIAAVGVAGFLMPASLVWLAERFSSPAPFYVLAVVRIAVGLLLLSVAPRSRMPRALRIAGFVIVALGVTTAVAGYAAVEPSRAAIEWWIRQGPAVVRVTAVLVFALGGFLAYSCAPSGPTPGDLSRQA